MDIQEISTSSLIPNQIATSDASVNETSYVQLEPVDYNRLCLEQAQLRSQNQQNGQPYVHSGQLVSMSGVIENGQFIPIQLNTMARSISNNSIRHSQPLYQQTNENQRHNPAVIAYQRSSPVYHQNTNVQASPPILTSNAISLEQERMKRGHHDVSSSVDNDISSYEEGWQTARGSKRANRSTFNSNISNAANQPTMVSFNTRPQIYRNQTPYFQSLNTMADSNNQVTSQAQQYAMTHNSNNIIVANQNTTASVNFRPQAYRNRIAYTQPQNIMSNDSNQVTNQAQRYAMTRYPFSPFVIHFKSDVRDKLVIEHLVKHVKEQLDFDLQIIGYRRSQVNCIQGDYDVLVFVETTNSFEILFDETHWPSQLVGKDFTLKKPSIPPQLSAVIQNVAFNIDWEDFTADLKSNYPDIVKVVRLKNRKLQDLKLVKIEIKSVKVRNEILEHGFITSANTRHKVVEYLALANVLICSRCMGIGHFQKNCPQHDQVTCKICGEKCSNITDHACSGVPKCIHCGEAHRSNDTKCPIVKDYRAALTRTLLTKPPFQLMDNQNFPSLPSRQPILTHLPVQSSIDMGKILKKMEEEGEKTRSSFELFKTEMLERDSENKRRIDVLNEQLDINERKTRDMQTTIKSLEEKFEVQKQTVQYTQNKADSTENKFDNYRLDMNFLVNNIMRLFLILRECKALPIPDDFYSLFIDKIKMLDAVGSSPSKKTMPIR